MTEPTHWRQIVWALAVAETLVWAGMYYLFPALLPHWEQDTGWSKAELAGAFTCALIVAALSAPLAGRLIDLGHGRKVLAISAFGGGTLVFLLSRIDQLWQFYALWIGIGFFMAGALYEACFAFLTRVLDTLAKRAITLVTLVAGLAGTVSFPTASILAVNFGWRTSTIAFAALICGIAAPLLWFSSKGFDTQGVATTSTVQENKTQATVKRTLRTPVFWLLTTAFALISLNHGMIITHLLPLLAERGVEASIAVTAAAMIGPMQVIGRIIMMTLERHVSITAVCMTSFLFLMLSSAALFGAGAVTLLIFAFVVLQGSGYGVTSITRPVVTAEYLGRTGFGQISGYMALPFMGATALAPIIAALLWQVGSYDWVIVVCFAVSLAGLLCFIAAARASTSVKAQQH